MAEQPTGARTVVERGWGLVSEATRRQLRRARVAFRSKRLKLVYHPRSEPPTGEIVDSQRARKILGHLAAEGWVGPRDVVSPRRVSAHQLLRVHRASYLASLDDPKSMSRVFGIEGMSTREAADYLEAQRWATGGTIEAARRALKWRGRGGVVANLGGGFHHAYQDRGHGFCAFNDVAVAIASIRAHGFAGRVLIVDLDLHHGDGTRRIFAHDRRVVTCSIHAASWDDEPAEGSIDRALGHAVGSAAYLEAVESVIPEAFHSARPELVFYVAGVDVAEDDRLGSWLVNADAILERDRRVIECAGRIPVVMVTAGGYGSEAWRYTARTLAWLASGEDAPVHGTVARSLERFRRIKDSLASTDLSGRDDSFAISDADVYGDLLEGLSDQRILGFYTRYGLELAFESYGLFDHLRKRGYWRFLVETTPRTGLGDRIRVYSEEDHLLLMELVVQIVRQVQPYRLLDIEWLLLQDPRATPTADRPLLPGQEHPGLGCLDLVVGMLVMACERLELDGLLFTPSHYHVAAQARGSLRFLDPNDEAFFIAMGHVTKPLPLDQATALVAEKRIVDQRGKAVGWRATPMVFAVSRRLEAAVSGEDYEQAVQRAAADYQLQLADGAGHRL